MRVLLKFELDCHPDNAWKALRSPSVFRGVSAPFMAFRSLDPGGFTDTWTEGEHRVSAKLFGLVPAGEQLVDIHTEARRDHAVHGRHEVSSIVRIVHDTGRGLTFPLTLTKHWHHRMAVSELPAGRTLYRDELTFDAGALTLPAWVAYWVFWQWRGRQIKRASRTW
jgi:hypothetical protein